MSKILNEELNYMKYLLGYKKGVVISEQQVSQNNDGCKPIKVIGSFSKQKTKSSGDIRDKLYEELKKLKFNGGVVTNLKIIGGASNIDGTPTQFNMDNNYNIIPNVKFNSKDKNNLSYATRRAYNAKPAIDAIFKEMSLIVQGNETVESYIVDTGGVTDENRTGDYKNPGQVVIVEAMICPSKQEGTTATSETIKKLDECYENSRITISYGSPNTGHYCSKALYNVYANGVLLKRVNANGEVFDYASLNNVGDAWDNADPIRGERHRNCKDGGTCGRSNTFILNKVNNKSFFNAKTLYKYDGALVVTAACVNKGQGSYGGGSDCHRDVGNVSFQITNGSKDNRTATATPNKFGNSAEDAVEIARFEACKTNLASK